MGPGGFCVLCIMRLSSDSKSVALCKISKGVHAFIWILSPQVIRKGSGSNGN